MRKLVVVSLIIYQTSLFALPVARVTAVNQYERVGLFRYKPYYTLSIVKVDGKEKAKFAGETVYLSPHYHQIEVECSAGDRYFSSQIVKINAKAGAYYFIRYPSSLKNYPSINYGLNTPKFIPAIKACMAVKVNEVRNNL